MLHRRMAHVFAVLLWVLAIQLAGCAQYPTRAPTAGNHVTLYADLSPALATRIQEEADRSVAGIAAFLNLDPPERPAKVLLFGSRRALRRYLEKESPHQAGAAAACFVTREAHVIVLCRSWRTSETLRYLRHELAHYVLTAHFYRVPPWINEGLAQFFELGPPYGRPHPPCLKRLAGQLRGGEGQILSWVVALPEGVRFGEREYAQAWGLTHFLLTQSRYGVTAVRLYLEAVNSGADPVEQFGKIFGRSPHEMESSWREHVLRLKVGN